MAELREIQVVIKDERGDNKPKPKQPDDKVKKEKDEKSIGEIIMHKAYDIVKEDVKRVAMYEINKWYSLNDDYVGQRNLTNALNVVSRARSSATAIVGAGKLFGGVGALIVGIQQALTLGIDIWQNYDRQNILLRQLDADLSFNRVRAGFSLTSNSIGESR